ncbi:hypothetical protein D9619_012680 [Psilocybe cf. subviscida]|uniref:GST N-terminal domain-containing protein n=1 Tax=Psilocybe cf. subviscida TaxID=2480587 RepID=A0A8H5B8Q1_9AGAR|nr:hypothetical protein D9619_012680 [Psilocybe cf. subviscida]
MADKMCLKLKGLTFETRYVEYPDIEPFQKENGFEPTSIKPDGSSFYTLPAIFDPSTGAKVTDSWNIAIYLDKTYPNTPKVMPTGTLSLQRAWVDTAFSYLVLSFPFIAALGVAQMTPRSVPHFRRLGEFLTGKPFDEILPQGEEAIVMWAKLKEAMGKIDAWYFAGETELESVGKEKGPFVGGGTPLFADIVVIAYLLGQRRAWGEQGEKWIEVCTWHGGRWGRLVAQAEELDIV